MNRIYLPGIYCLNSCVCVCVWYTLCACVCMWETCQNVWISVPCAFAYGTGQTQGEGTPESVVKSVALGHMAAKCPRKARVLPRIPFVGALALRSVPWLSSSSGDLSASVQGPLLPTLHVDGRRLGPQGGHLCFLPSYTSRDGLFSIWRSLG